MLHSPLFLPRRSSSNPGRREPAWPPKTEGRSSSGDVVAYEILLMFDPELPDERQNEILARMREQIERNGTWGSHEPWGRRRLAYEIDHKTDGIYHLVTFTTAPDTLAEVSRVLKITDGVMRHMAVRLPQRAGRRESGQAKQPSAEAPAREAVQETG